MGNKVQITFNRCYRFKTTKSMKFGSLQICLILAFVLSIFSHSLGQTTVTGVGNQSTTPIASTPVTIQSTSSPFSTQNTTSQATTSSALGTCNFDRPYVCPNNEGCYSVQEFCDGIQHCSDGSDETRYNATIHANLTGRSCARLTKAGERANCYIPAAQVCNHQLDCFFGNDECDCAHSYECIPAPGHRRTCRARVQFCDNNPDCPSRSDETPYSRGAAGFQCPVTKTQLTNSCMLPNQYVCDGTSDCDDGTDECFCDKNGTALNYFLTTKCFRCLDQSLVIPEKRLCDMTFNCGDLSDECICTHRRPALCDQVCKVNQDCGLCHVGQVMCSLPSVSNGGNSTAKCINRSQVCDQRFDCPNKEDESNCADKNIFTCADGLQYVEKYKHCDNYIDCNDGSDELNCNLLYECSQSGFSRTRPGAYDFSLPGYATKCNNIPECEDFDDECNSTICGSKLPEYCAHLAGVNGYICPNSLSGLIGKEICDGFPTCNDTAPNLSMDELNCTGRFYCHDRGKSGLPIHIAPASRCNQLTDCQDSSDEMGCNTTTHFYCASGSPKYIPRYKVCNGVQDCKDGEDECQNCATSPFSSDQFLISSYVLQAIIWIIGLIAVLGNLFVIIHNGIEMFKATDRSIGYVNRVLVLNLALADFLLGIYLVGLGSVNSAYQNIYCRRDIQWRTSTACAVLGSIAMISVETSVFILTVMTSFRLAVVVKPFTAPKKSWVISIFVVFAWLTSLIIALIPHSESSGNYFTSGLWYRNNPFLAYTTRNQISEVVTRLQTFQDSEYRNFTVNPAEYTTWKSMSDIVGRLGPNSIPELQFGYYAAHGVCMPRLFPDPSVDTAWGYSLFVIIINFCAFIYMVAAYIAIYKETKARSQRAGKVNNDTSTVLQRKISRIVFTNFCCWIPICIMAFISVGGGKLSSETYAVAAIVLLPINSAANPFLYSDLIDVIWKKLKPLRSSLHSWTKSEDDTSGRAPTSGTGIKNSENPTSPKAFQDTNL